MWLKKKGRGLESKGDQVGFTKIQPDFCLHWMKKRSSQRGFVFSRVTEEDAEFTVSGHRLFHCWNTV